MENFADRLSADWREKDCFVCVGIDPILALLPDPVRDAALKKQPETLQAAAAAFAEFGKKVIDAVAPVAAAVKPQSAFFEMLGPEGMRAMRELIDHAHRAGLLVIADAKRGDIGPTAQAYAQAVIGSVQVGTNRFEPWEADAVTVNPYLGSDGILPFVAAAKEQGGGLFVLVKTSNKSSGELQDLVADGRPVYEHVAEWIADHAGDLLGSSGYSSLGAVVGATYPEQLARLRKLMPKNLFLIPGYGAQGGGAADVKPGLNADGLGAIVNASRSVIFAWRDKTWAATHKETEWTDAVADAARKMRDEINQVRR